MDKIDWRAVVETEDGEELDLKDSVEVLSCAINLLVNEHNNLVDLVNVLTENALKTKSAMTGDSMSSILGSLGGMFGGGMTPPMGMMPEDLPKEGDAPMGKTCGGIHEEDCSEPTMEELPHEEEATEV